MKISVILRASLLAAALGAALTAHATFLVPTTGGTDFSSRFYDPDNNSAQRQLGGSFSLYGTSVSSIYVQTNGFLSTANGSGPFADRSVGALSFGVRSPVVAPFYDDLYLDTTVGDSIADNVTPSYYAVSFAVVGKTDRAAGRSDFQAVLVKSATTLQGNALQAGDIVLSYNALNSTVQGDNFSVGVAASATNATYPFGSSTGQFATTAGFLANFDAASQALLFRYDAATGTYAQSLITYNPVPEPSALLALGLPALALLRRRR